MDNDALKASLVAYAKRFALTPEQREQRRQAASRRRWLGELRRQQEPALSEYQQDAAEGDLYW
jgi:hypothetical protein